MCLCVFNHAAVGVAILFVLFIHQNVLMLPLPGCSCGCVCRLQSTWGDTAVQLAAPKTIKQNHECSYTTNLLSLTLNLIKKTHKLKGDCFLPAMCEMAKQNSRLTKIWTSSRPRQHIELKWLLDFNVMVGAGKDSIGMPKLLSNFAKFLKGKKLFDAFLRRMY